MDFIRKNNDRSIKNMNIHCNIIKKIIHDVIKEFDVIKKYNVCAFITGSFARCSNKKNSDIDFQFAYPQKYKNKIFKYEEMIYYIIATVVGIKRSSVHSMLITRLNRENINYLEKTLDEKKLVVNLHSDNGDIFYEYEPNIKRRIYLQYGNCNSLKNIFKYLKYEVENNNKEWCHVFYVFSQSKEFNNCYDRLFNYEKEIICNERISKRVRRIKEKIIQINELLEKIDTEKISEIKLIYQKKEFAILNEYISYKRDIALFNNIDWKYINYFDNYDYLNSDKAFNNILDYLFIMFDIVEPLEGKYSLHNNENIVLNNYNTLKKEIKKINKEILNILEKEGENNGKINYNNANSTI